MPGLSQLKEFNKDLLSLGNEITLRAARGEKPVQVQIPSSIEDVDDSEDFVLGMPENEIEVEQEEIDDDLSELTGLSSASSAKKSDSNEEAASAFEAPDMSDLLAPMGSGDDGEGGDMPDLSMFMDEPVQEEPEPEPEPEEISVADMSLEALLAGGGFDEPEQDEEPEEAESAEEPENLDEADELESPEPIEDVEPIEEVEPIEDVEPLEEAEVLEEAEPMEEADSLGDMDAFEEPEPFAAAENVDEAEPLAGAENFEEPEPFAAAENVDETEPLAEPEIIDETEALTGTENQESSDDLNLGDLDLGDLDLGALDSAQPAADDLNDLTDSAEEDNQSDEPKDTFGIDDYGYEDFDYNASAVNPEENEESEVQEPESFEGESSEPSETGDDLSLPSEDDASDSFDLSALSLDGLDDFGESDEAAGPSLDDFSIDNLVDGQQAPEDTDSGEVPGEESESALDDGLGSEDTEAFDPASLNLDDMDLGLPEDGIEAGVEIDTDAEAGEDESGEESESSLEEGLGGEDTEAFDPASLNLDDMDLDLPEDDSEAGADTGAEAASEPETDLGIDLDSDTEPSPSSDDMNDSAGLEPYSFDIDATDSIEDTEADDSFSENQEEPLEVFDTSDIEDLDFGIAETDDQLGGGADFELGNGDDFAMEGEFEIPGFSDVETAKEEKKSKPITASKSKRGKGKDLPEPDFSNAEEGDTLPPNTLSDAQYKQFLKNLSEYPLNVRLAFEDLIVQDEFTDDAEFEIIEKILNKAPARQVASMLEKMLDISIPVPRDFEHRTADEYEAYKKSLSYQLRNKIIPAALIGAVSLLVLWGLFNFTKNCIYKPIKANNLYKQGYELLEADEYPQSEMKFNEAVSYRISKKWFFNYARGYRAHKQYQRAGNMYQNILKCFRHDKPAGLEYADMELNDMANYPRAEEIVRREVLDYHINDKDGILMLGDIFLEWATDKDPSKFELAREQYATLIQLYEPSDLYKSRMMRYFIRTDNLREVLQLKPDFENRDKSLSSEDWAELSGYLLDKYYGPMDPSEEYLRYEIEGLRGLLLKAVKSNPDNPIAYYNLAKYFINTNELESIESTLQRAIEKFNTVPSMKNRDVYKYIDSYRLLGEHYMDTTDYLQAQEQFVEGISLYTTERDNAGFLGTPSIGKLYEDMGNIKYSISGDYDEALLSYKYSVELENDSPSLRYRIGYIQYKNKNYLEALGAFMKAGDGNIKERNLQLAMANTLFLRGDDYAAEGYYNQLIDSLDAEIAEEGIVFPQTSVNDYDTVNTYLYAANNYGVTLYHLAKRTGNSALNAQSIVQFSQSVRAWDALTRNQNTLERLPGSNLAEQNIKYITSPIPNFEPSIYIDIPRTLTDNERL